MLERKRAVLRGLAVETIGDFPAGHQVTGFRSIDLRSRNGAQFFQFITVARKLHAQGSAIGLGLMAFCELVSVLEWHV